MHRLILGALVAILAITAALAAGDGTAVGVNPDAIAKGNGGDRTLVVGDDIAVGERIVTGNTGQVQIIFSDQTKLVVGPGSSLVIEKYLLRNDGNADKLAVRALAGTFRFISGTSPKSAYQISTPTAAIAVRGTKFDIAVTRAETLVMLYQGALTMCAPGGIKCVDLSNACDVGETARNQATLYLSAEPERIPLTAAFRYARVQTPLLSAFRVSGAGNCLTAPQNLAPGSLVDPQLPNNTNTQSITQFPNRG